MNLTDAQREAATERAVVSVSRVAYDAALKRVHEAMDELGGDATPRDLTLAALGLDEPPTEACECGMPHSTVLGPNTEHADECPVATAAYLDGVIGQKRVVPPAEPPKACERCGGKGHVGSVERDLRCDACGGSGIDGGTA